MKKFSYIVSIVTLIASIICLTKGAWASAILTLAISIGSYDHASKQ